MSIPKSALNQWTTTSITSLKLPVQNYFIPHDLNVLPSIPQQQPMKIHEGKAITYTVLYSAILIRGHLYYIVLY